MLPKIAILIPCYNAATYLPDLFEGIKAQTQPFSEIICYDDCSTDHTIAVATSLGANVIKGTTNRGPAFARNRLIAACQADYIHFHDADDLINPQFVEQMSAAIVNEQVQLLCNTFVLDRDTRQQNLGNITYNDLNQSPDQLSYFLEHVGFASMGLYSKQALQSIGGFREDIKGNEDPDLHIRLVNAGFKIKPISHFLVTKLEHHHSFSHQNWFQCLADKLKCLQSYYQKLDQRYHSIIGTQAAYLSNYFYKEGNRQLSSTARQLAFKTGLKKLETTSFSSKISGLFGLRFYLWLYRRRVDLNLV